MNKLEAARSYREKKAKIKLKSAASLIKSGKKNGRPKGSTDKTQRKMRPKHSFDTIEKMSRNRKIAAFQSKVKKRAEGIARGVTKRKIIAKNKKKGRPTT